MCLEQLNKQQFSYTDFITAIVDAAERGKGWVECPAFSYEVSKWSVSPYINHFLQPDTIIPSPTSPQSRNRYSYVLNNPISASDPSGHKCIGELKECQEGNKPINGAGSGTLAKPKPTVPVVAQNPNPSHHNPTKHDDGDGKNLDNALNVVSAADEFYIANSGYTYTNAKGNISLTASPIFTEQYGLASNGNYTASTISTAVSQKMIQGAGTWSAVGFTALSSLATNLYDYTYGAHAGESIATQEFAVSVGVDTVLGVAVGIAAATMVAAAVTAGAVVAAPVAIVGVTVAAGIAIGAGLSAVGAQDMIKSDVNWAIDSLQGEN